MIKYYLFIVLTFTINVWGYTVDGVNSGKTAGKLCREAPSAVKFAACYAMNSYDHNGYYNKSNLMGEPATIYLKFTAKSLMLYKTEIIWSKAFYKAFFNKEKKEKFFYKIKSVLIKKYGNPTSSKGSFIFIIKDKSSISLSQDVTSVKLLYVDFVLNKKAKKEATREKKEKDLKSYKEGYNAL